MPVPKVKVRKKPTNKRCEKGFPCKTTCISREKNCKAPLKWQAKTFLLWEKAQQERLALTNKKRERAGLTPAQLNDSKYITAERTKLPQSETAKVEKVSLSPTPSKPTANTRERLIAEENRLGKELDAILNKYPGRRTDEQKAEIKAKESEYFAASRALRNFNDGKAVESPTVAEVKPIIGAEVKSAIAVSQTSKPLSSTPSDLTTEEFAKLNYKKIVDRLIGDLEDELKGSQKGITKEYRLSVNKDIAALKSISSFEDVAPVLSKIGYDNLNKIAFSDHLDAIRSKEIPKSLKDVMADGGDINKEILARRNNSTSQASAIAVPSKTETVGTVLKVGAKQVDLPKPLSSYSNLNLSHDPSLGWQVTDKDGDVLRQPKTNGQVNSHRFKERSQAENFAKTVMAKVDRAIAKQERAKAVPKSSVKEEKAIAALEDLAKIRVDDTPKTTGVSTPNAGEQLRYNELTKLRHRALLGMSKGRTPKESRELYDRAQSELNDFEKRFPGIKHTITQNEREKAQWDKTESDGLKSLSDYQSKGKRESVTTEGDRAPASPVQNEVRTKIENAINNIPEYPNYVDRNGPRLGEKDKFLLKTKKDLLSVASKVYGTKTYADQVTTEDTRQAIANLDKERTRLSNIIREARNNSSLSKSFNRDDDKDALGKSLDFYDQLDNLSRELNSWHERETNAIKSKARNIQESASEKAESDYQKSIGDRPSEPPPETPAEKTEITIDPKYTTPLKGADKVTAGKAWNRRIDQQFLEMKKLEKEKQMEFLEENISTGEKESVVRYPLTYGDNFGIVKRELGDWNIVDISTKKTVASYPTKLDAQRFIASVLGEIGDKPMQQMSRSERQALIGIEDGITGLAKLRKTHGNPNRVNLEVPPYIRQKMGENTPSLPIGKPVTPSSRPTTSSSEIKSFRHTKLGHELFAVNPPSDPTPREKQEFASKAKAMGGRYSSYDKDGAIAGYLFRDKKKAEQFRDWMGDKQQTASQPKRTSTQTTEVKPTEQKSDRASVAPEPVKENRSHPSAMNLSDKLKELKEHYEWANPMPQGFRRTASGKYIAVDNGGMAYGKSYETEADAIKAYDDSRKKRAEDSYNEIRQKSEKAIDGQIEYWRKERGIKTNSAPFSTPPSDSTYQPTAKEFGDRLTVKPEDFKGNTIYLGVAPNSDGYEYSYRDKEWIKSKYGDVSYGNEYRIVKDGAYIAIESRPFVYKKDGNPLGDRLNEGDWKSQYGRQNIEWNQEGTIAKIADFGITEKTHPLVANAVTNKEKRQAEQVQREKEAQVEADKKQAKLTAWTAIKKEMVDALPKPKKGQFVSYQGTDKKDYEAKADLYGDNYAILKNTGDKTFSVSDVKSGYLTYASGLTATKAKELLGVIWKERGDKPVIQDGKPDVSEELKQFIGDFRIGREDSIPDRYSKEVDDRVNSSNSQKAQAMQSNLFGGLDEIPVDKKREDAIAVQSSVESTKKIDALNRFRPYVKPKKESISDKELDQRIKESNDYFKAIAASGGKKLNDATNAFYQDGEPGEGFSGNYDIERIFKGIDQYEETGNKQKIALTERIAPTSYYARGYSTTPKDHSLDPSDEKGILDFMRDKLNVKIGSKDTIADVRERFNKMRSLQNQSTNTSRPKWLDAASSSVDTGRSIAGVGLTPTTKGFVAEQLFKLSAFDFPSAKDYEKDAPMVTIRTPGGGQYQIYKTKEAISTFLDAIGLSPKKGETLFDALKRNSEIVQNFSEPTLSPCDRHLLLLATTAANRIMSYPESLRQGINNRLRGQLV